MKAFIIANGELPPKSIIQKFLRETEYCICADGGANHARKLGIIPDIILGDFDSIADITKRFFKNIPQEIIRDQHSTDLEKAILHCIEKGIPEADIIGAFGTRVDHTVGSLGCFKRYRGKIRLTMIDAMGVVSLIDSSINSKCKAGDKISLIPLDRCEGVTTKNLTYVLKNDMLENGVRDGISNITTSSSFNVTVKKGTLLLYRFFR